VAEKNGPTMMARIWKLPAEQRLAADMSSLRVVFHMASACPIWLKEAWIDWIGPDPLFELYGGTERQGMTIITGREPTILSRGEKSRPRLSGMPSVRK